MPDFTNPIVPKPFPLPSQVTMASISIPVKDPVVGFSSSEPLATGDTQLSASQIRDFILGSGKEINSLDANKVPVGPIQTPWSQAKRYDDPDLGFNPFRNNEDVYADDQGVFASLGSGLGRLGITTATKLGSGLGYLGGLVTSAFDPAGRSRYGGGLEGWVANAADNAFTYQFDKWEQNTKDDLLPIYQEASDANKGFFKRALTDLNFWTDDVTDGLAFMASALAPGLAVSKVGVGARALAGIAKAFGYTDAAIDAAQAARMFGGSLAADAISSSSELNAVPRMLRIAANAKLARNIDVGLTTFMSTASEAMFEASETKKRTYDHLLSQGEDPQVAAHKAALAARDTYAMNIGALMFSNLWEANLIFNKLGVGASAAGRATREGLFGATTAAKKSLWREAGLEGLKGIGVEGFYEENIQLAIQRMNEGDPSAGFFDKAANVARQYVKQTAGALSGSDPEAAMNIGIGGLIGGVFGAGGAARTGLREERQRKRALDAINTYGAAFRSMSNIYNSDGTLNQDELIKFAASQNNVLELMDLVDLAEENQAPVLRDIYESELFSQFAHAHFEGGMGDLLHEKLAAINNLSDQDLQSLGFDPASRDKAIPKLQRLQAQARQLQELYDNIEDEVVDRGTKTQDDKSVYQLQKNELYRLGARSITLNQQAQRIQSEIDTLSASSPVASNPIIDELNKRHARVQSIRSLLDQFRNEESIAPGEIDPQVIKDTEEMLADYEGQLNDYIQENQETVAATKRDSDGFFSEDSDTRDILNRRKRRIAELKLAEIEMSKRSVDARFDRIANPRSGHQFVKNNYDRILKSRSPRPSRRDLLPLDENTTEQSYGDYEFGRLRRQRIKSGVEDIGRQAVSELISSKVDEASLEDLNSLIDQARDTGATFSQADLDRINNALNDKVDNQIKATQDAIDNLYDRKADLSIYAPEDMTPEELDEYDYVVAQIPLVEQQLADLQAMKSRAGELGLYKPLSTEEEALKRGIADEYFVEPEHILSDLAQSQEGYDSQADLDNVNTQIRQLEALRRIFSTRTDLTNTSQFNGFNAKLNDYIDRLKEAAKEIGARMADRGLADQRALNNHVNITGNTIGVDLTTNSFTPIYTTVSTLLQKLLPTEFAKLSTDLQAARDKNDTKEILYHFEAIQQLIKSAITDPAVRNQLQADIDNLKKTALLDFVKQKGNDEIRIGRVSDEMLADAYGRNPNNVFKRIIERVASAEDLTGKSSSIYKYLQDFNISEFTKNVQNEDRSNKYATQEILLGLIRAHIAYTSLTNLERVLNSDLSIPEEVDNELSIIDKSINSNDPEIQVLAPSNEQLIALRQLTQFIFTKLSSIPFSNMAYLKGAAGTGKSAIISKWLLKIAKISKPDVFAIGHNEASSNNINRLLGKGDISPQLKDLIDALNTNQKMKLILVDEIGGFQDEEIIQLGEALDNYNNANKSNVKMILLGDPNQLNTRYDRLYDVPAIETVTFNNQVSPYFGRFNNITYIQPLTIRYRSDISQVNNFADKFINQNKDLSNDPMITLSTNPTLDPEQLRSNELFGVVGTKNFSGFIQNVLPILSRRQDGKTRAIITSPSKVKEYQNMLVSLNIPLTDVEILSYLDAQGRTLNEVYIDIPNNKTEFEKDRIYNKAMYVAASRATDFVAVANYNIQNEGDPSLGTEKTSKQADIKKASDDFRNDRTREKEVLGTTPPSPNVTQSQQNNVTPTPPGISGGTSNTTAGKTRPSQTPPPVTNDDLLDDDENPEDNPAPTETVPEEEEEGPVPIFPDEETVERSAFHNLDFPTSETANDIIVYEGAVTPSYSSPASTAQLEKAGIAFDMRNRATSVGDKVFYVPVAGKDKVFFVLATVLKDANGKAIPNRYRQLGVLSDSEMEKMKNDPDQRFIYDRLTAYASDPKARTSIIDLDKHEFTDKNLISALEGEVSYINFLSFKYNPNEYKSFNLDKLVSTFVKQFFTNEKNISKRIDQVKKDAKIIIYKYNETLPNQFIVPGVPYLVLSNLGQGASVTSKPLYIRLDRKILNRKEHKTLIAPVEEFVKTIDKLNALIGEGNFIYGNAQFENAIIKIARRGTLGPIEIADRKIEVSQQILDLAKRADDLHIRSAGSKIRIGSKVKYIDANKAFFKVGRRATDSADGTIKKGDLYSYKEPGEVVQVRVSEDPNSGEEIIDAVKVRSYELVDNTSREVLSDWIPATELTNTKTENGEAQVALNTIWKANQAALRNKLAENMFIEGTEQRTNNQGEVVEVSVFKYPSLLRSDRAGREDIIPDALATLKALLEFDDQGSHISSDMLPQLYTHLPRRTNDINFTNDGINSIDDAELTSKYLRTNFEAVNPTRISVRIDKPSTETRIETRPSSETQAQDQSVNEETRPTTKKKNLARGRRLAIETTSSLGAQISLEEARKLVRSLLPGLSEQQISEHVQMVNEARMMEITGGRRAWGFFVDNMIYLQSEPGDTVRANVARHEVAHYVFNNYLNNQQRDRFIKELTREHPQMNFMTYDEKLEFTDEYIADRFQNYQPAKTVGSFIRSILRKIANFLGFAIPFIRNIDNYIEAIQQGLVTKPSNEQLDVSRPLLSIKDHFNGNVRSYLRAREMFAQLVNDYMNPQGDIEDESGQVDPENIPVSREEAVQRSLYYFQDRLAEYQETPPTDELDIEDFDTLNSLLSKDGKGKYFVFEELVKDFYPNFRFIKAGNTYQAIEGNEAFDYDYSSEDDYIDLLNDDELFQEGEEDSVPGNEGWLDNQDTINPLKKASQAVKDFMSSMTVKVGQDFELIKPGYVFYKLLQNLTGVDINDLPQGNELREEIKQIRDNFISNGMKTVEDESDRDWVIFDNLISLLNKTERQVNNKGIRLPQDSYFRWVGDNQRGHYEFVHKDKNLISSLTDKGKKKSYYEFFKEINTASGIDFDTIKTLYEREEAASAVNSIYEVINSMRKKYPMFGEYEWVWTEVDGRKRQYLRRKYGAFKDETSLAAAKGLANNTLESKYDQLSIKYGDKIANRKNVNQVQLAKEILMGLGLINSPTAVYLSADKAANLLNIFEALSRLSKKVGTKKGIDPDTNEEILYEPSDLLRDARGYIGTIAQIIASRQTEVGRSSSYSGGDKKPRWFYMNSTQAYDTFRKIIENRVPRGFLTNKGTIFNYNIFNPSGDKYLSRIYSIRDHDSIGQIDATRDPILYSRELSKDFMDRNFMYGFVNFVTSSTQQGITYLQQFYTISNKPNMLAAQVDVLDIAKIKQAISTAIDQEANRTGKGIANYEKNVKNRVTYLPGLERALEPDSTSEQRAEALSKVYDALTSRARDAFERYMNLNPILDDQFTTAFTRLAASKYMDENILREYPDATRSNITGSFNYDKLDNDVARTQFEAAVFPMFHLFYVNYFMNSLFLNQLVAGDQAQYKNEYDEIKRMSMAFAIGYRGRVNDDSALRRTFNVAVVKDFKDVIDSNTIIGRRFKKLFGATYDLTDAQGYATPERVANIRRGFSREANIGATLKPVYFGIDPSGIARGIKYSTIELTNELVSLFPDLARLRFSMTFGKSQYATDPEVLDLYNRYIQGQLNQAEQFRYEDLVNEVIDNGNHIDEIVFDSAFKVGKPTTSSDWRRDGAIDPASVVTLTNDNYRHQLNPRHDADAKTRNPSQLTYQVNTNGKNFTRQVKLLKLNALAYNHGIDSIMRKIYPDGQINAAARHQVRRMVGEPLGKVPGNERYAEFMRDGEISLNLPNITNKLQQSFLAFLSKRTVEIKHKGSKLVLQSSFGTEGSTILRDMEYHEPRLVFLDKNSVPSYDSNFNEDAIASYYMEVYLPDIYKSSNLSTGDTAWINDPVYSQLLGYRIPSTELHSAVPLRVAGFYPSKYGDNIVIAPKELVVLHGSDFDIDSLYTVNRFVASKDIRNLAGNRYLAYEGNAVGYKMNRGTGLTEKISEDFPQLVADELDKVNKEVASGAMGGEDTESWRSLKQLQSDLEELLAQAISNEILSTFLDTISAEENIDDMMTPISMAMYNDIDDPSSVFSVFADLNAQKQTGKSLPERPERSAFPSDSAYNDAVNAWNDRAMSFIRPKRNLNAVEDELEMHQDNFRAALGTGVAANAFKIISYLYMAANRMDINTSLREDQQVAPHLKPAFHMTIDGRKYEGFSRYIYRNGKLQDGTNDTQRITSFQVVDSLINAAIDHVKEQILNVVNISAKTINGYLSMIAMGIDPVTTSLFMTQPVIREISNRASSWNATNDLRNEMRIALMKGFASDTYKEKYEDIMEDDELSPNERQKKINALANKYFEESFSESSLDNTMLTTQSLSDNFKIDYNVESMDKNQLLFQLKVLNEFKKMDLLGDYLSKGSRALKSLQQIPSTFAGIQNLFLLYNKFFDVDAALHNADPNKVSEVEVQIPSRLPFDNVRLDTVPNIQASIRVLADAAETIGKFFLREGKTLVDFSDYINSYMLDAGLEDTKFDDSEPSTEDYVKQFDRGFLDWNAARSLQKIRENFIEYLMTSINFDLPDGRRVNMSTVDEPPLDYTYKSKYWHDESESYVMTINTATATGTDAWMRRFIDEGFETVKNGRRVRLKPLTKIIDQYGIKAKEPNNFISNLIINRSRKGNSPYIRFGIGSALDTIEKVDYENEFGNIRNLSIYEDENGNDVPADILGEDQYNELQYNLLKYDILANGLAFGSSSYSQIMSIPIYRQISKQLDSLMFSLLDEKKATYDIMKIKDHFAIQLALMNISKVKALPRGSYEAEGQYSNPVPGYDETYDTYYDVKIPDFKSQGLNKSDIPKFAKRGNTLYINVVNERNQASPHLYYQKVERYNDSKAYSFTPHILESGYSIKDYFNPSKLTISALEMKPSTRGNGFFNVEINPMFEPKAMMIKTGSTITIHSSSDYSRMNASEYIVRDVRRMQKNRRDMFVLNVEKVTNKTSIDNTMTIDKAKSDPNIQDTINNIEC